MPLYDYHSDEVKLVYWAFICLVDLAYDSAGFHCTVHCSCYFIAKFALKVVCCYSLILLKLNALAVCALVLSFLCLFYTELL